MTPSANGRLAVRAARIFDGLGWTTGVVLVEDGVIAGIADTAPAGWPVLDRPGATVLPGLVDVHVHLVGDANDGALDRLPELSREELFQTIETSLRAHLAAGVTTVRDLGDMRWSVLDWRANAVPGLPHVVAAGPPITSRGGHCWNMGGEATGVEELRAAVRERAERGADLVKIMASGGIMTAGTSVDGGQFTEDELRAVVEEAHALGLPVTAHAHAAGSIRDAIAAGVDGIEHCSFLTADGMDVQPDALAALAANGVAVCPTLGRVAAELPPALTERLARNDIGYDRRCALFAGWHGLGVTIVSGTDGGIRPDKPHGLLPGAVADLVTGGMPVTGALAGATSRAAAACGLADRKGRLLPGHDADLLVVDGDPEADITALLRPDTTILRGRVT